LVADVERSGDQRRLLKLCLLDASERAVLGKAATACGSNQLGAYLLAGERGFDQGLPLLDHAGAGFGRGGKGQGRRSWLRAREKLCGCIAGPRDEPERDHKKHRLKRCRDAKATQLGPVVNKQVPVTKQTGRYGQNLRHLIPLHNRRMRQSAPPNPIL